jgi:hypothetical protein
VAKPTLSERTIVGRCQCGAVQYLVADQFLYAANCHCSDCRRATGSAFKPFAGIEQGKLRLTVGTDQLMIFGDESGYDAHCRLCGSLPYSLVRDGAFVHVAMGTLVDDPTIRPAPISSSVPRPVGSPSPTFCPSSRSRRRVAKMAVDQSTQPKVGGLVRQSNRMSTGKAGGLVRQVGALVSRHNGKRPLGRSYPGGFGEQANNKTI